MLYIVYMVYFLYFQCVMTCVIFLSIFWELVSSLFFCEYGYFIRCNRIESWKRSFALLFYFFKCIFAKINSLKADTFDFVRRWTWLLEKMLPGSYHLLLNWCIFVSEQTIFVKLIAWGHHLLLAYLFAWSVALFMNVVEYSFKNS